MSLIGPNIGERGLHTFAKTAIMNDHSPGEARGRPIYPVSSVGQESGPAVLTWIICSVCLMEVAPWALKWKLWEQFCFYTIQVVGQFSSLN